MRVIIIGGGTAGTICAFELRKQNKEIEITIIEETKKTQYSPCAMPYVLSGEIPKKQITLLKEQDYENNKIKLLKNTKVQKINTEKNEIITKNKKQETHKYDYLVIATGSQPLKPNIKLNTKNNTYFKNHKDLEKIIKNTKNKKHITIIGAGYIGIETATALREKNKTQKITIIENQNQILANMLDEDMSKILEEKLKKQNITIIKEQQAQEITKNETITNKQKIKTDYTIISIGTKPNTEILQNTKIKTNNAIKTNKYQQTNIKNIYACGDCTEITNKITKEKKPSNLANIAYTQAKTVANNILGKKTTQEPTLNSSITKINKTYIGTTGITQKQAQTKQKTITTKHTTTTTPEYYSKEKTITIKIITNQKGQILGMQTISDENISQLINLINLAITKKIKIQDITKLETPYNPASNPLHDPLIITAKIQQKKINTLK